MFELEISYQEKNKSEGQINLSGGKIGVLKKLLESIAEVVDHVEIKAKEHGLEMQVMDSMHSVLVDVYLSKSLFDKYRCDRDVILGIKIKDFVTILKDVSITADSIFHMSCEDSPSKMSILYTQPSYKLNWDLSLFTFDFEAFKVPEMEYSTEITLPTQQFLMLPKVVGVFGEFLSIESDKDTVAFKQVGETTNSCMTLKQNDDDSGIEINVSEPLKKELAIKYLNTIAKVAPLCSKVKICFGRETPVFFDFSIYDLGHMRYYIAPKVPNE